jgi:hypothetical protein
LGTTVRNRPRTGPKEVSGMQEVCYCGRSGEIEDREVVRAGDGRGALRCPDCIHMDHLSWLPAEARDLTLAEAKRRAISRGMPMSA